ncbi:MAG: ROK family protein [Acidobacteriota bacterium]|nr:MAG: ROK family protein [Acidobacteriota bacterium]
MQILGIDIGGTGVKGAPVDTSKGVLLAERLRLPTPKPSTPRAVADVVAEITRHFGWTGRGGCGFPGVVRNGVVLTAANVSKKWLGVAADSLLKKTTGCDFVSINDADAAGVAELRFGAGKGKKGVVLVLTLGTGIGSALYLDGKLVPNIELGQLEINGRNAEKWASAKVRNDEKLSWKKWATRLDTYLDRVHSHFWPELIILGGGVSKNFEKFAPHLTVDCPVVPATLRNKAGIIGAALHAAETS